MVLRKQATDKILNGQQKSNEALIEISRKEVLELRSQMNQQHHLRLASEKSLYDTNTELKRWRQEAKILELENNLLKQKIDDLEFKLSNAEIQPESKIINTSEKTKNEVHSKNANSTNNANETKKLDADSSEIDFSIKLVPQTKFNPAKYNIKPLSKQELNLFCKERTLTVIENDLLCRSPGLNNSSQKYNIPDLSQNNICDFSFETFDDEVGFSGTVQENALLDTKNESATVPNDVFEKAMCSEDLNKENVKSSILNMPSKKLELPSVLKKSAIPAESGKMKRKVCFSDSDDSRTDEKPKLNPLRGGKILVPKKKIILVSNATKKA